MGWNNYGRPCVLTLVTLVAALGVGCGPRAPQQSPAAATNNTTPVAQSSEPVAAQAVALEIDFGDGKKQLASVPWREGMTALDVLVGAEGGSTALSVERRGEGPTAFVEAVNGQHNGGGAKADRNWLFRVNDRLSPASAGTVVVKPGDRVLWQYAVWE